MRDRNDPLRWARLSVLACVATAVMIGCSSSSGLVNVWMDPQYNASAMQNMLVVSMNPDVARRRIWEDAFADALRARGVKVTPSYQLFPNQLPDTSGIITAVNQYDYDGIFVTARLATEYVTHEVPAYLTDSLVTRYNPWSNRYYDYYQQVYTPGYTETQELVRHKIEVWRTTGTGDLVWTATSQVLNPAPSRGANDRVVNRILDDLADNKVIPSR